MVRSGLDDVLTASGRRLASVAVQSGDLIELRRPSAVLPGTGRGQTVVGPLQYGSGVIGIAYSLVVGKSPTAITLLAVMDRRPAAVS